MSKVTQLIMFSILFVLFAVNATATVVYSRSTKQDIKDLNITAQNKCIVRVVLSNLPPITSEQFNSILRNYEACVAEQTNNQ